MRNARRPAALVVAGAVVSLLVIGACGEKSAKPGHGAGALVAPTAAERETTEKIGEAKALLAAGGAEAAEPLLRRALELSPRDPRALSLLTNLLVDRRAYSEAVPLLRRLVDVAPDDTAARQRLFDATYAQRDFAAAAAVAQDWTKAAAGSCDAWYALGCASHDLGRTGPAEEALRKAMDVKASRADVRSRLGLVLLDQGRLVDAESAQRDALRRDPRLREAWFRLGDTIERAGPPRYAEAIAAFRRAVEDPPRFAFVHARLYRLLALVARADGSKLVEAESEWKTLLRVVGREVLHGDGLGAPQPAGDASRQEKPLRDAVLARPDDAATRFRYAMFLQRQGDLERAVSEFEEAARADPKSARIAAAFGSARLSQGDPTAGEAWLDKATRLDPADETTWRSLGWARLSLGRDADAVAAFDEALKRAPSDRLAQRLRGLAKLHAGDLDGGMRDVVDSGWTGR